MILIVIDILFERKWGKMTIFKGAIQWLKIENYSKIATFLWLALLVSCRTNAVDSTQKQSGHLRKLLFALDKEGDRNSPFSQKHALLTQIIHYYNGKDSKDIISENEISDNNAAQIPEVQEKVRIYCDVKNSKRNPEIKRFDTNKRKVTTKTLMDALMDDILKMTRELIEYDPTQPDIFDCFSDL